MSCTYITIPSRIRICSIIIISFISIFSYTIAFAQTDTFYVSSNLGNDLNNGSELFPLKTIQACVDKWNSDTQIICLCSGIFTEYVKVLGGGPSKSLRNELNKWDTDGDGDLDDENFILDNKGIHSVGIETGVRVGGKASNIKVANLTVKNIEPTNGCSSGGELSFISLNCKGGDSSNGCNNWIIEKCIFDSMGVNCQANSTGQSYIALRPTNASNLIIRNNRITNFGGFLMRYFEESKNVLFKDNHVEIKTGGIKAWGNNVDSLKIINNKFIGDGNGYNGTDTNGGCSSFAAIRFSNDVQNSLIEGNYFKDCPIAISINSSSRGGSRDNKNHLIQNNFIEMTDSICKPYSYAIELYDAAKLPSINTGDSIEVKNLTFRNNFIIFNQGGYQGSAIFIRSGHDHNFVNNFKFYNNTISGFKFGINIQESSGKYNLNGLVLKNNIFHNISAFAYNLKSDSGIWSPDDFESNFNVFNDTSIRWNGITGISSWRSTTLNDSNSFICVPNFTDSFRLSVDDSCAKNNGITISNFNHDYNYAPRSFDSLWDIGADEYTPDSLNYSLPVSFIEFSAKKIKSQRILVRWQTALEINNDYFVLLRSLDGIRFDSIALIKGQGSSSKLTRYNYIDFIPEISSNIFYRLKQVDLNSNYSFSDIVQLNILEENRQHFDIIPNPVKDIFSFLPKSEIPQIDLIKIYNHLGKVVNELYINESIADLEINIRDYESGVYFIEYFQQSFSLGIDKIVKI